MRPQLRIGLGIFPEPAMRHENRRRNFLIDQRIENTRVRRSHTGVEGQRHGRHIMLAGKAQLRLDQPCLV